MPVQGKSIYEPESPDDGVRILTTNYWPRGISKTRAGTYKRVLGPSRDLLRAFKDGEIQWPEYEVRFREEMREPAKQEAIREVAHIATEQTVTVMCVCKEPEQCHRRLLVELIEKEIEVIA